MDAFHAIADPVRRDLLTALARGPARVADLAADHPISRPAVSKHLRVLTEAGLTVVEDRGRERHYALEVGGLTAVQQLLDVLRARVRFNDAALDGLDLEVRRTVRDRETTRIPEPHEETA